MINYLLIYIIIIFIIFIFCARLSYKYNLLDIPNDRKIHTKATAYTGGIALSIIYLFSLQLFNDFENLLSTIISIAFLIAVIGFIDDKYHLNTSGKLSLQVIPIVFLVFFENLSLEHIGEYDHFKLHLGTFSTPFVLLSVLFLTNSFNYFDGLDGTLSFCTISVLVILYFLVPDKNIRLFLLIILIPIFIFLLFNFSFLSFSKLFLGDSGSLLLGFIISFILIYIANKNLVHPILLAWSIVIFVYEFLSINIIRIKNEIYLFKPGQDHLHHLIYKKNKSIFLTNISLISINVILFLIGYISFKLINNTASLIIFILMFILYLYLRNIYYNKLMIR
jgi:UDP-GlcNAc:undecaprenyl-phosphate/decaprenyl-phosphate GlcNAc-1-phosphate transferase